VVLPDVEARIVDDRLELRCITTTIPETVIHVARGNMTATDALAAILS
jgi:hypothetical protein